MCRINIFVRVNDSYLLNVLELVSADCCIRAALAVIQSSGATLAAIVISVKSVVLFSFASQTKILIIISCS